MGTWWSEKAKLWWLAIAAAKCANAEFSPDKRRWDCKRVCSNTRGVNCTVCWSYGDIWTINMYIYIFFILFTFYFYLRVLLLMTTGCIYQRERTKKLQVGHEATFYIETSQSLIMQYSHMVLFSLNLFQYCLSGLLFTIHTTYYILYYTIFILYIHTT